MTSQINVSSCKIKSPLILDSLSKDLYWEELLFLQSLVTCRAVVRLDAGCSLHLVYNLCCFIRQCLQGNKYTIIYLKSSKKVKKQNKKITKIFLLPEKLEYCKKNIYIYKKKYKKYKYIKKFHFRFSLSKRKPNECLLCWKKIFSDTSSVSDELTLRFTPAQVQSSIKIKTRCFNKIVKDKDLVYLKKILVSVGLVSP